jgi:Spy/CpxP family protein refolding chaperone
MIRTSRFMPLALGAALALSAVAVSADLAPAGPRAHAKEHAAKFQERYNLTDEQMTVIREAHARQADQRRELGRSLHRAQRELRQMALSDADAAQLEAKTAEVSGLMSQLVQLRAAMLREIAPVLTPEQREQMAKAGPHKHSRHGRPGAELRS